MNLMREEDLSFQLLQDADTVHKYANLMINYLNMVLLIQFKTNQLDKYIHNEKHFLPTCRYVASRGQREKEEDIYEVFPPTITVRHRSTRIIRHR